MSVSQLTIDTTSAAINLSLASYIDSPTWITLRILTMNNIEVHKVVQNGVTQYMEKLDG